MHLSAVHSLCNSSLVQSILHVVSCVSWFLPLTRQQTGLIISAPHRYKPAQKINQTINQPACQPDCLCVCVCVFVCACVCVCEVRDLFESNALFFGCLSFFKLGGCSCVVFLLYGFLVCSFFGWVAALTHHRSAVRVRVYRITKMSPRPWSKTISMGTRESEQPRIATAGRKTHWKRAHTYGRMPVHINA
jgi:hypothetical protein